MSIFIEVAGNGVQSMNGKLPVCNEPHQPQLWKKTDCKKQTVDDDDDEVNTDVKVKA